MADTKISALPSATTPLAGTEVLPIVQGGATDNVSVADLTAGRTVEMLGGTLKTTVDVAGATTSYVLGACPSVPTGGAVLKSVRTTTPGANHEVVIGNVRSGVMNDNFKVDENGNIVALLGNFQVNTAAKGVNFTANTPAAGMTSQLLNWYEEGTFTPTITGATTAGTGTYTNQVGRYTRIGRAVHFTIYVTWTAHTGTGTMLVGNLPYASNSTAGQYYQYAAASDSLTYGANTTLQLLLFSNQTKMTCYSQSSGAALAAVNIDTQADLIVTGTYFV